MVQVNLLRMSWWQRILAGDSTAIPAEWETEDGRIKMAGESAREFLKVIEENHIEMSPELSEAAVEYIIREVIDRIGQHPNGMTQEEWSELYETNEINS